MARSAAVQERQVDLGPLWRLVWRGVGGVLACDDGLCRGSLGFRGRLRGFRGLFTCLGASSISLSSDGSSDGSSAWVEGWACLRAAPMLGEDTSSSSDSVAVPLG